MNTQQKLSYPTRFLHWLVAFSIIGLTGVGIYMANMEAWFLYPLHKSIGLIVFVFIILRVIWRLRNPWPAAVGHYKKTEQMMAKVVHWVLLIGTIIMPLSGMVYSGLSGHGFGIFGWAVVEHNLNPERPGEVIAYSEYWANIGEQTHEILGYMLAATIVLHIAGALKHHLIDKDRTLLRMLGK